MKGNDFNFLSKGIGEEEKELFFGPFNGDEEWFIIEEKDIMANVLVKAGIFPSISQARKNGWNKPIPEGFTNMFVGKHKKQISILKKT